MNLASPVGARIGLSATFEYRDAAGNILKTVQATGSIPLADIGAEEAQELMANHEGADHGTDNR